MLLLEDTLLLFRLPLPQEESAEALPLLSSLVIEIITEFYKIIKIKNYINYVVYYAMYVYIFTLFYSPDGNFQRGLFTATHQSIHCK